MTHRGHSRIPEADVATSPFIKFDILINNSTPLAEHGACMRVHVRALAGRDPCTLAAYELAVYGLDGPALAVAGHVERRLAASLREHTWHAASGRAASGMGSCGTDQDLDSLLRSRHSRMDTCWIVVNVGVVGLYVWCVWRSGSDEGAVEVEC